MKNIFTSRMTLIMAGFGLILSLLLNLISGVVIGKMMIRVLLSTLIMGGIAILIQFLVTRFIPQEHLDSLLKPQEKSSETDAHLSQEPSPISGNTIDITDDSPMNAADLYTIPDEETPAGSPADSASNIVSGHDEEASSSPSLEDPAISTPPVEANPGQDTEDSFQATDFSEAPRVQINETPAEAAPSQEKPMSIDSEDGNLNPLPAAGDPGSSASPPPNTSPGNTLSTSGGDVSFTVDNKKINADPKIIAKAIKTVLSRD